MSVITRDTVREQVVVAVHDTLREVTTITVQLGQNGDTVKVAQVTERDRVRDAAQLKDKSEKIIVQTDTVYIEHKDSVEVKTTTNYSNFSNGDGGFRLTLKWIFAIICAIIVLVITVMVKKYVNN